jgi:hypothetical protein
MPASPSAAAEAAARDDDRGPGEDRLTALRARVAEARDLQLEINDTEARLKELRGRLSAITGRELPEAFDDVGIQFIGLDARGNLPAYLAKLVPYYRACISSEWGPDRQAAGFAALEGAGGSELIKCEIVVRTGRGELDMARSVRDKLEEMGVDYSEQMSVHHSTLTAWLRHLVEKERRHLPPDVLEAIGGSVGSVVKIEPIRERGR